MCFSAKGSPFQMFQWNPRKCFSDTIPGKRNGMSQVSPAESCSREGNTFIPACAHGQAQTWVQPGKWCLKLGPFQTWVNWTCLWYCSMPSPVDLWDKLCWKRPQEDKRFCIAPISIHTAPGQRDLQHKCGSSSQVCPRYVLWRWICGVPEEGMTEFPQSQDHLIADLRKGFKTPNSWEVLELQTGIYAKGCKICLEFAPLKQRRKI